MAKADVIYINGHIYTADQHDTVCEAIAIQNGYIVATGCTQEINNSQYVDNSTIIYDLQGKTMMPGIIDAHLHTFWGGMQLSSCNLNYQSLTVDDTLAIIQQYLDNDSVHNSSSWLQVRGWLRQEVLPIGTDITRFDLDKLNTQRPIILFSNDCHTLVANSIALEKFGLDRNTPEPSDGKIGRTKDGDLNGILEDAPAMRAFDSISKLTDEQAVNIAKLSQEELNKQGVTAVMDARITETQADAFLKLQQLDQLSIRLFGARELPPDDVGSIEDIPAVIDRVKQFAEHYNDKNWQPKPGIKVSHTKLFVDGVMQAPLMTARLLQPYQLENEKDRYGDLYYSIEMLDSLILESSRAGFHPHMHTVGEGAIEVVLNAIEKMRKALPNADIRPSTAHNELSAMHQFDRYKQLNANVVFSFQWAGCSSAMIEQYKTLFGAERYNGLEAHGQYIDAGVTCAFGSDWPIDPLNEWYDFQIAMTRQIDTEHPRLNSDRNLTALEVLRCATIDAAYVLKQEDYIGSIEKGKFADVIILDRNPFTIPATDIQNVKVLTTIVGGKTVYQQA
ncbi:amidohydrolase [Gilliamella sp. W8126]|uniref:amidohydrolase n=1 Tax=Gilliamella sp. W8126 TaxID=2750946 RepID=UPI0018DE8940|nr:amidohydrolase [Gilliamella sp. W8126]MBI0005375.1 amidohydrolase [Gilliamella sp. W8126]